MQISRPMRAIRWMAVLTSAAILQAQTPLAKLLLPGELPAQPLLQPGTLAQEPDLNLGLHIEILQGDRGVNVIKKKTVTQPVVEVRDRNNLPVGGVVVTFTSPSQGPSAVFLNGSHSVTVVTDSTGRAAAAGMKPVGAGSFKISVAASYHGQAATATLSQINVLTAAAAGGGGAAGGTAVGAGGGGGLSAVAIGAIVGGVAAAAVGIGVGLSHGGHSSSSSVPSTGITQTGSPTVGPPH